ncbi:MAG: hypothetical protein V1703_03450, partial [Candidatus Altiarchaeota archaeon]
KYILPASLILSLFILEANPFIMTLMMLFLVFYPVSLSVVEIAVFAVGFIKSKFISTGIEKQKLKLLLKIVLKPILIASVISLIAFLLISFKAVPTLYFAKDNPRLIQNASGFDVELLKEALLVHHPPVDADSDWWERNGYIGLVCLLLSLFGIFLSLRDKKLFSLFLFLLFIILYSFSQNAPINLWDVFHKLPLFSSQRIPERSIAFISFILPLFAGVGLAHIEKSSKNFAKLILIISLIPLIILNTPLIEGAFSYKPDTSYPDMPAEFHQGEYNGGIMYHLTRQNVGVTDYSTAACLKNRATPVQDVSYRGEAYILKGGYARLLKFSPNEVKVFVNTSIKNTLVLNQNYYEGWYADETPAKETNGLVSVDVNSTTETVVFHYYPPGLTVGLILTILGILISIAIYFKFYRR